MLWSYFLGRDTYAHSREQTSLIALFDKAKVETEQKNGSLPLMIPVDIEYAIGSLG